jgi:hypothetical protein
MRKKYLILISISIYSCNSVKEAQKAIDNPQCHSIVEAFYTTDTTYTTRPPFLLLKKAEDFNGSRYLYGGIGSISDSGVVLIRSKKTKFFPYEEIKCLIDSNNQIVYGEWNKDPEVVWEVSFICRKLDVSNSEPFSIILTANQVSSYCIEPGDYKILCIKFSYSDEYLDQSDSLYNSGFKVSKDAVTYIGNIHAEYKRNLSPGMINIPTKVIKYKNSGYAAGAMFGAVGGLIGALADEEKIKKQQKSACLHGLQVKIDSSYKPSYKGRLPLIQSPVLIERPVP